LSPKEPEMFLYILGQTFDLVELSIPIPIREGYTTYQLTHRPLLSKLFWFLPPFGELPFHTLKQAEQPSILCSELDHLDLLSHKAHRHKTGPFPRPENVLDPSVGKRLSKREWVKKFGYHPNRD